MLLKFSAFVFLLIFVLCQTAPLANSETKYHLKLRTADQLAGLDEYFARKFQEESALENLDRKTRYLNEEYMISADARPRTAAFNKCIERVKLLALINVSEYITKMDQCYRYRKGNGYLDWQRGEED